MTRRKGASTSVEERGASSDMKKFAGADGPSTPSHAETSDPERANILEDERWMKLVEECVEMVEELDEHMESFDAPRREVARHVILRLEEILGRSGVEIISNDATFDRARHKPDAEHAATDNGAAVRQTLSAGFAVGPRVLRRARVRLE
jgi:molecular chaperone GrpE (heat shock protein)